MADRSHLQVVAEGAKVRRKASTKIASALDGSARDVLASMRLALAKKLDDGEVSSNAIASAYKELRELDRLIRAMDDAEETEGVDRGGSGRQRRSFDPQAL